MAPHQLWKNTHWDLFLASFIVVEEGPGQSDCDFRKDIHAADLGGDPELGTFLDADHGRLAADPTSLPRRKLGRKNEHKFHLSSPLHLGIGIEEYPISTDVAGLGRKISAFGRTDASGNARGDACSRTALGLGFH